MIDVEPRDARWWVMAEDDYRLVRYNSGFYPNYTKIRANSMKFTKILISLASLSYSSLSNQYKKHAGVQDTTTTDTSSSSSNKIHALITITDTECGISPFVLLCKSLESKAKLDKFYLFKNLAVGNLCDLL
ncbi:unnamed protein product [Rhizophagus irregularis]|nr:unnamed protein product [Rhizophagus irregularis]